MCLLSSQPSSEAGIAQVLMRHLLLGTLERETEPANQSGQVGGLPRWVSGGLSSEEIFT